MENMVISVNGKDSMGIIAAICTYFSENGINVVEISQNISGTYFSMMMIVDIENMTLPYDDMIEGLAKVGERVGVSITCQNEEIFSAQYRG